MEYAISIVEAARRAGVGRSKLYQAIKRRELRVKKCGSRSIVLVDDLVAWVKSLPDSKTAIPQEDETFSGSPGRDNHER